MPSPAPSTERRLFTGSAWLGAAQVVGSLMTLVSGLLVVRLLPQHDIGLMGIALLASRVISELTYPGVEKALIQRESSIRDYLNVAWSIGVVRGGALSAVLLLAAYPLSRWYGEPRLLPVLLLTALVPGLGGFANVGPVYFTRELDFRALFLLRSAHAISALVISVPAILLLKNIWALVLSHLGGALIAFALSYAVHPYRPRWEWEPGKVKELWSYGKWLTLTAILVFVVTQGDDVFVSKYFGPAMLAVYQLAYDFANLPTTHVSHVLGLSSFPVYSRLQADVARLRSAWMNVMRGVMLFSSAVTAIVMVMIPYIVEHVVGPRWSTAIPLIQILVIAGFVRSFQALAGPMFQAVARTDLDFRLNLPRFFVVVLGIWPACAYWGIEGACWVVVASIVASLPFWFIGVRETLQVRPGEVLRENVLALISGPLLFGVLLWLSRRLGPSFAAMFGVLALGIAIWLLALWLLGRIHRRLDFFAEISRLRATLRS
jgi:lipopolysaccharide exporter